MNVEVAGNGTATIGQLTGCGKVVKTGTGTLSFGNNGMAALGGEVRVSGGAVSMATPGSSAPAAYPAFHVDASQTNTLTIVAENGSVIDLRDGVARNVGQLDLGIVYVDGSSVGEITDADLKDRRILGEEGFISVIVVVDAATGRIISGPEVHARGFAEDAAVFESVKPKIAAALAEAAQSGVRDNHALSQVVRRTIGRWVNQSLRRRPMIVPLVIEA